MEYPPRAPAAQQSSCHDFRAFAGNGYLSMYNGENEMRARRQHATRRNHGLHQRLRSADRAARAPNYISQKFRKIGEILRNVNRDKAVALS